MLSESDMFVWEMAGVARSGNLQGDLRARMQVAFRREQRPLYYAAVAVCAIAYVLPVLLIDQEFMESWATNAGPSFWVAVAVIFGAVTLVVSPIFALLAHERSEAHAILESSRQFAATRLETRAGRLRLKLSNCVEPCEVEAISGRTELGSGQWLVYAIPEESSAAVIFSPQRGELLIGRLHSLPEPAYPSLP